MNFTQYTIQNLSLASWVWIDDSLAAPTIRLRENDDQSHVCDFKDAASYVSPKPLRQPFAKPSFDVLRPMRHWLNKIQIRDPQVAHRLCQVIPAQCPFERNVELFGHKLFHIPPMCKLNPLYEEVVGLRFRALCYLADQCGEDITQYC